MRRVTRLLGIVVLALCVCMAVVAGMAQRAFDAKLRQSKQLINEGEFEQALFLLKELEEEGELTAKQQVACIETAATACCWSHEFKAALSHLGRLPEEAATEDPVSAARCRKLAAWAHEGLGNPEQSLAASEEAVALAKEAGEGVPREVLSSYLCHTAKAMRRLNRREEAAALYREAAKLSPIPAACAGITEMAILTGSAEEALQGWMMLCCSPEADTQQITKLAETFTTMSEIPSKAPDPTVMLEMRPEWLAQTASRPDVLEQIQWVLVRLLIAKGQLDAGLCEGKALVEGCSGELLPEVAGRLSLVLKRVDGSVARANSLLEIIRWGTAGADGEAGTEDDIADPFANVVREDSTRDAQYRQAIDAQPLDWQGRLARATLYRYWGKHREALEELKLAFDMAPMEQEPIRAVAQATMRVLMQLSGTPQAAEEYADYQRYGAAGADGRAGTDDDLKNPVAQYIR